MTKAGNKSSNLAIPTTENPQQKRVFSFLEYYGDKMGTKKKYIHYKPPQLKMEGDKWFVAYHYRVPNELFYRYKKKWMRFRVYEDINRFRDAEYAETLREAVGHALDNGFNPFEEELKEITEQKQELQIKEKVWTIQQAIMYWEQKWRERGIKPQTLDEYFRVSQRFITWLVSCSIQNTAANDITENIVEHYLKYTKEINNLSNRSYNNERDTIRMIFRFFEKKKIIQTDPTIEINKKRTQAKKHKAYDTRTLEKIVSIMQQSDPYIYFAFQVVYHLCIRSCKELRAFKVCNIIPDRMQVFLPAEDTKTGADRYIPMSETILKIFRERGILDCPANYHVFSAPSKYKFIADGKPGLEIVGQNFFAKRFSKVRKLAGLSMNYTLYAAKHTRIVHLKTDGVSDADIMALTGHADFTSYAKYLRDLGIDVDPKIISDKTREI